MARGGAAWGRGARPAARAEWALAAGNDAGRWWGVGYDLRRLGIRVATGDSVLVVLAGFALTVTPGKLGEAVKALLLRQSHDIPARPCEPERAVVR